MALGASNPRHPFKGAAILNHSHPHLEHRRRLAVTATILRPAVVGQDTVGRANAACAIEVAIAQAEEMST